MTESAIFEWACATLESASQMTRLQSRGTLRLILKQAGLEPGTFNRRQLAVIAARMMPGELHKRGIAEVERICAALADCPESIAETHAHSPDDIFDRLGKRK
jgi:hypothetical protein